MDLLVGIFLGAVLAFAVFVIFAKWKSRAQTWKPPPSPRRRLRASGQPPRLMSPLETVYPGSQEALDLYQHIQESLEGGVCPQLPGAAATHIRVYGVNPEEALRASLTRNLREDGVELPPPPPPRVADRFERVLDEEV